MIGSWTLFAVVAIIEEANYPITAQAAEPCQLIYWPKDALRELVGRFPRLSINAMQLMAMRVREYQDRFRELATERVERRLARALIRLASQTGKKTEEGVLIDMPLTRQDLAEMTGTTLFTASRVLSQWEAQGLVKSGRERVVIVFPHGLVRIADDLPPASAHPD
jgi:CRP-like cAMP-binding protein